MSNDKSKIWENISKGLPIDLQQVIARPVTKLEVYHLLERFATLTIWNAYNLDAPGTKQLLTLKNASPHFNVYDRGSCLVMSPKELFSHTRTLWDGVRTAIAMIDEIHKRPDWTAIELEGFDKLMSVGWAWVELLADQQLQSERKLTVMNFQPRECDAWRYLELAKALEKGESLTPNLEILTRGK